MSEGPALSDDEAVAAEHALGVLSAAERAAAEARMARDPTFAAAVEDWRARLSPLAAGIEVVAPPAGVWPRIAGRLPANDNIAITRRLRFWRSTALGGLSVAAASLAVAVMLANRPPVVLQAEPTPALLNASLAADGAQPLFVASYDPMRKALIITSLARPGADPLHVHQLWLIPGDGKPRAVGLIEPGKSKAIVMPEGMAPMAGEGAALAVSIEAPGGSTTEKGPLGPIAAVGKLAKI